ncbi:alanine racemase [Actinopolymorpha pittospori]|uniref:D-serine dehydratase n=1 Tax=Actinopolymorpha pittospori TaxID=648752 RepID=A0A927MYD2_9ACTN|nr:alanine racemase [Actinopolymorpha pittospori]MBE1608594.1 D-serine dehydratase [Actinopolymorpha pittospori]
MTNQPMPDDWQIDWRCKGFPPIDLSARDVPSAGWRLHEDFSTPIAAIRESALAFNLARMRDFCAERGVELAPHGKTTMSPELIRRQLDHGAWGMTAATAWQARAMTRFGVRRILVANECLDPAGLRWLGAHLRDALGTEISCFVDSVAAVTAMRDVLAGVPGAPPVPVLVEVGLVGGRCGARTAAEAVEVAAAVAAAPELELVGVAGFEGVVGGSREKGVVARVEEFLRMLRRTAQELIARGSFPADRPVILSAGGSAFFDLVVEVLTRDRSRYGVPVEVVLRSGCYLVHDHGAYQDSSPFAADRGSAFRPALEVWSRVLSCPEPGLALTDAGKRDMSTDGRLPLVLRRLRHGTPAPVSATVQAVNDQHAYLRYDVPDDLRVGDLVCFGISHPCTTFDKWRAITLVDDDHRVTSVIRTSF